MTLSEVKDPVVRRTVLVLSTPILFTAVLCQRIAKVVQESVRELVQDGLDIWYGESP